MKCPVTCVEAWPWVQRVVATLCAIAFSWIAARAHALAFDLNLLADKGDPSRAAIEIERLWQAAARADVIAIGAQVVLTICIYIAFRRHRSGWRGRTLLGLASLIGGVVLTLLMVVVAYDTQPELAVRTDQFIKRIVASE